MNVVVGIIITKEFENIFTLVYLFQGLFTVTQIMFMCMQNAKKISVKKYLRTCGTSLAKSPANPSKEPRKTAFKLEQSGMLN